MTVTLTNELLNDAGSWDILDQIVFHFLERRHLWNVADVVEIENSGWIQADKGGRASNRNLEILQKCYTDSIYPDVDRKMHASNITITLKPASLTEFKLTDARSYLAQPVYVFVENSTSDGAFLGAMLQAFKRAVLLKAKRDGWWVLEHLGGFGELERRITQTRQQSCGRIRAFVMADSDRFFPGHRTQTIDEIETYCISNNIPFAILRKRKIENYLPVEALQTLSDKRRKTLTAYLRLTVEQRNHYEMKHGFVQDRQTRGASMPPEQTILYQGVPPFTLKSLIGGFGKKVWQLYEQENWTITEESIRMVCEDMPDEIPIQLNMLEQLL